MTDADLLRLAQVYAAVRGLSLNTVGYRATGGTNYDVFERMLAGRSIQRRTREKLARWFREHWPPYTEWPDGVPRRPRMRRLRESGARRCAAE